MLIAFIAMQLLGLNSNIMSLGGIAIAIGAMVDAAIVMIENAHKHLERLDYSLHRLAPAHAGEVGMGVEASNTNISTLTLTLHGRGNNRQV